MGYNPDVDDCTPKRRSPPHQTPGKNTSVDHGDVQSDQKRSPGKEVAGICSDSRLNMFFLASSTPRGPSSLLLVTID